MDDEDLPPVEGDPEWRERTQETNELAEKLPPPHDDETERGNPSPAAPGE
jgi:hypothetical protein